jgi:hypothetical protein
MLHQLKYIKTEKILVQLLTMAQGPNLKSSYIHSKNYMCLMLLYYVFCFNIIKMVTEKGFLKFYCIFLCMVFVLAYLRMT